MTARSRPANHRPERRGRPSKYGQPSQVVAVTLPVDVVDSLRRMHSDLGWAIVGLVQTTQRQRRVRPPAADAQLMEIGDGQFLIVVNSAVFRPLPGVQAVPLSDSQAFLALEPGRGLADLELAILDRLDRSNSGTPERRALVRLRAQLRKWRQDRHLEFHTRAIIIGGRVGKVRG